MADTDTAAKREQEKHLVAQARAGDADALRALVDQHKERLFSFVWRMIRRHHDAEEICQDAFLKAFASLDSFSSEYRFSTWLFTIAYRICLNRLRRKRPLSGELDVALLSMPKGHEPPDILESEEAGRLKDLIWSAVDRLSPPQSAAVLLFYRYEVNCQEISRILGVPVATVKSHLHRARGRLREMLESVTEGDLQEFRNRSAAAG